MIRLENVKKAIAMINSPSEWLNCDAVEKQLAMALELYQDRGEFDGTLISAIDCLELACYEIEYK